MHPLLLYLSFRHLENTEMSRAGLFLLRENIWKKKLILKTAPKKWELLLTHMIKFVVSYWRDTNFRAEVTQKICWLLMKCWPKYWVVHVVVLQYYTTYAATWVTELIQHDALLYYTGDLKPHTVYYCISVLHGGHCGNKQKFHILCVNMSNHCQVLHHLFTDLAATEWDTCKTLVSVCTWLSSASASGHRGKHKSDTRSWGYQWNAVIVVVVVL